MSTEALSEFDSSLSDLGVSLHRTTADGFDETLREVLVEPAVGTDLPFEGVDLDGLGTETDPTSADLERAATGVTPAGLGVAAYGSLVVESRPAGDEPASLYPERHVAVLRASDVVPDLGAAFDRLGDRFDADGPPGGDAVRSLVFATGPSATADMGALVEGVHGPGEVHVVVLTDR